MEIGGISLDLNRGSRSTDPSVLRCARKTKKPRSLSENPARSREQSERNRHIMFYAKRLPGLPS